jgi:3-hydroxyisobutyrate dehydrogenase-like beta-hydroxyacid dehydrogenase
MTANRSTAYGRVMRTLADVGPAKLHDLERQRIRNAADTLLFAVTHEPAACEALADMEHLSQDLIDSGRWSAERAQELADEVAACGPSLTDLPVMPSANVA